VNVLVLAAHPDDETIGAGGTIARLADSGARVHLWIATEAAPPRWSEEEKESRRREARRAAEILGVESVSFGGFPTMHLRSTPALDLNSAVDEAVRETSAEVVLAPPPADVNSDHSALFDAALVACRALPESPVRALYAYEISTTTGFCPPERRFEADTWVDISATLETKLEAMRAYESELREAPHPRSIEGLTVLARERGLGCGFDYAEGFRLAGRRIGAGEEVLL